MSKPHPANDPDALLKLTDLCVMCGMCIPACPTYQAHQLEAESPRGRIALVQSYLRDQVHDLARVSEHLQHCTGCRNCETICPSRVPYGEIYHSAAARLYQAGRKPGLKMGLLMRFTARPGGLNRYSRWFRWLARMPGYAYLGKSISTTSTGQTPPEAGRTPIYLFVGCMEQALDSLTLAHARSLLAFCGYQVIMPETTSCCGSLHQHLGDDDTARHLADKLAGVYDQDIPLVYLNAGCGARLEQTLPPGQAVDLVAFLHRALAEAGASFAPLDTSVAMHTSCSRRNKITTPADAMQRLLGLVPGLRTRPLSHTPYCCGAGAAHGLSAPQQTAAIRQPLLQQLSASGDQILVSDNMNCSLNFREGLQDTNIRVIHPITLLWQQLEKHDAP